MTTKISYASGFTRAWQPLDDLIAYVIARRLLYLRTVDITLPNPM